MGSRVLAVLVCTPAGQAQQTKDKMTRVVILLVVAQVTLGARQLRGNGREAKSLTNTFPFNSKAGADSHHGDHHGAHHGNHGNHGNHVQSVEGLDDRISRQGDDTPVSFPAVAAAGPGADGKRYIDKVEMVEETEYDETVQCDHSYDRRCHTTYVTQYESQQEEDCEENFRKNCFIEYEQIAFNETAKVCRTPLVHDVEDDVVDCTTEVEEKCEDNTSGYTTNTKCSKWPKEVCSVSKKSVKKYTPITGCTKEPRELCAPAGCGFKEGAEVCYDKTQTVVQDAPKEECSLEPQRTCQHVTNLVPKLEPTEECVDVPKEVCTRSKTNPRKVKKPVIKKWCYVPTEESGLA